MLRWRQKRPAWPSPTLDDVIHRSRILIIDDQEFPYKKLFENDGYNITKWQSVRNFGDLENRTYDLILLDLQGVAEKASSDDGLGILKHIRETSPYQLVVAFSSADFPLKYQQFFDMADSVLPKSADYPDFKEVVDRLLVDRFRRGFYFGRLDEILGADMARVPKLSEKFDNAVLSGNTHPLRSYLSLKLSDPDVIDAVISLAEIAIKAISIWAKAG